MISFIKVRGRHHHNIFRGAIGIAMVFDCCNVQSVTVCFCGWKYFILIIFRLSTSGDLRMRKLLAIVKMEREFL